MPITRSSPRISLRLIALLIVAWGLLTIRIGAPWFGHHDWNGVWVHAVARNWRLYGAWNLHLIQVSNYGPAAPETYNLYNHRPPLAIWLMALAAVPLGLSEASLRFVTGSATLIGVAALYTLSRRLHGPRRAWWSAAFYALTPMIAYFGRMPEREAPSLAVSMLYAAVLVNWLRCPTRRRWLALAGLSWIGVWTDWTALLYVGALSVLALWLGRPSQRRAMLALGGVTFLALVALVAYLLQGPGALESLIYSFLWRTSGQSSVPGSEPFTYGTLLAYETLRLFVLATPGVFIMNLAGIILVIRHDSCLSKGVLAALFAVGIGYLLIFRNVVFVHEYFLMFLMPPVAMTAPAALVYGRTDARIRRYARPAISGLLLVSLGVSIACLMIAHRFGERPNRMLLAQSIARQTAPHDLIATNLHRISPAVDFYAFRNIEWDTPPDAALIHAQASAEGGVYAYCSGIDNPTSPAGPPVELAEFPYEVDGGCLFFRLR